MSAIAAANALENALTMASANAGGGAGAATAFGLGGFGGASAFLGPVGLALGGASLLSGIMSGNAQA